MHVSYNNLNETTERERTYYVWGVELQMEKRREKLEVGGRTQRKVGLWIWKAGKMS